MRTITKLLATAAVAIGVSSGAHAALLTIEEDGNAGFSTGTIPDGATNEVLGLFSAVSMDGHYGGQLRLTGAADLTIDFFGAEAGFANSFQYGGAAVPGFVHAPGQLVAPDLSTPLATFATAALAGVLDFSFIINSGAITLSNGANGDNTGAEPNFFLATNLAGNPTTADVVYAFLDDGGAGNDDNHDDFLIRISAKAVSVPEPASLGLLAVGLIGLGMGLRRRRTA